MDQFLQLAAQAWIAFGVLILLATIGYSLAMLDELIGRRLRKYRCNNL